MVEPDSGELFPVHEQRGGGGEGHALDTEDERPGAALSRAGLQREDDAKEAIAGDECESQGARYVGQHCNGHNGSGK